MLGLITLISHVAKGKAFGSPPGTPGNSTRLYLSRSKWQVCKLCSEILRQLEFAKDFEAKSLAHQLPALKSFLLKV